MIHETNKRASAGRLWRNKNVYHYYYPLPTPCNASILYSIRNNNNNGIQIVTFPGQANEINTSIAGGHDRPNYHTLPPVCDTSLRPCVTHRYLYNNNNGCTSFVRDTFGFCTRNAKTMRIFYFLLLFVRMGMKTRKGFTLPRSCKSSCTAHNGDDNAFLDKRENTRN